MSTYRAIVISALRLDGEGDGAATAATAKATAATYSWSIALQAARTVKVYPRRFNMVGCPFPDCADRHRSTKVNIIETHPKIYWPCTKHLCSEYRQEFQASMSSTSSGHIAAQGHSLFSASIPLVPQGACSHVKFWYAGAGNCRMQLQAIRR